MNAVPALATAVGIRRACDALGVSRASWYRARKPRPARRTRPRPPLALRPDEVEAALAVLHADRFIDLSPRAIFATLLEEHRYLGSISTLYRLLAARSESRERRAQRRHPRYARPELLATAPNQLWSWDITKLKGPAKWVHFLLYVILDVFSRCVVGWMVAHRESSELANRLIRHATRAHRIPPGQLTLHADRGSSMKSKPVALLLADLGVTKTHSRPPGLQRQPLLRSPVQNPEIPTRVPRPLRLHRRRPRPLQGLLPLVQPPTPALRHRSVHPRRCPPRTHRTPPPNPTGNPRRRLPRPAKPLQRRPACRSTTSKRSLDQSARNQPGYAGYLDPCSLNAEPSGLILIDTFRGRYRRCG